MHLLIFFVLATKMYWLWELLILLIVVLIVAVLTKVVFKNNLITLLAAGLVAVVGLVLYFMA